MYLGAEVLMWQVRNKFLQSSGLLTERQEFLEIEGEANVQLWNKENNTTVGKEILKMEQSATEAPVRYSTR